jgi:hypothetical protein
MLFYALSGLEISQPATAVSAVPPNNHKSSNWVINLGWGVKGGGWKGRGFPEILLDCLYS